MKFSSVVYNEIDVKLCLFQNPLGNTLKKSLRVGNPP